MAAAEVQWGELDQPYDHPAHCFDGTDRASANIDRPLAAHPDGPVATSSASHCAIASMDEAVAEVDRIGADGNDLPPSPRHAPAEPLLYLRRPREASNDYDATLATNTSDMQVTVGRISG
jgi:hypothetical protein